MKQKNTDYPQVEHPWAGDEYGHNCVTCGPDGFYKCDRMAHVIADVKEQAKADQPALQAMQRTRRKALDESLHKGLA